MFVPGHITDCDVCRKPVNGSGFYLLARGATGRVCPVMCFCRDCQAETRQSPNTWAEAEAWAESVPGGYLDS